MGINQLSFLSSNFPFTMLTHHRKPVCLSLIALDLPVWSVVETAATVYQKDTQKFHVLLTEPHIQVSPSNLDSLHAQEMQDMETPRLLWLEVSPYRVIMTMQGDGKFSYRHFWEQGVYGISRYWMQGEDFNCNQQIRLRNYTRKLHLVGRSLPQYLRVEYELWSNGLQLGQYILNLEIHH